MLRYLYFLIHIRTLLIQAKAILSDQECLQQLIYRRIKKNILTVPIQSVTTRTDTTKVTGTPTDEDIRTIVFVTDGTYAFAKDVKTGIQDNSYIEINSGVILR